MARFDRGGAAAWLAATGLLAAGVPASAQEAGEAEEGSIADCGLYQYEAVITEVYDGDTVTADIDLGFSFTHNDQKLRLFGIDAPEVRGDERPEGLEARDALRDRILGEEVTICSIKDEKGKYGRYLARIYHEGTFINAWLVFQDLAEPEYYD